MGISDDIRPKKAKTKEPKTEKKVGKELAPGDGEAVLIKHNEGHDFVESDIEEQLEKQKADEEARKNRQEKTAHDDLSDYFYRTPERREKKSSAGKWIIAFLIIALVGIIIWQNLDTIKSYFGIEASEQDSSDPPDLYSNFSVTDTPADTSADASATLQQAAPAEAAAEAPAKSTYTISVLNGNGVKGTAASVAATITAAGYQVSNTGNALKFSYTSTIIYYKTGKVAAASDIKNILASRICELSEDNSVTGNYDIVVVVGKN